MRMAKKQVFTGCRATSLLPGKGKPAVFIVDRLNPSIHFSGG